MSQNLGRGLGSLIPQKIKKTGSFLPKQFNEYKIKSKDDFIYAHPDQIQVNPMQPRKEFDAFAMDELVKSIKDYGIIQPLVAGKNENNEKYELIVGERRLRAAKILALNKVPVIIRNVDQQKKLEIALVENLQREDLNTLETARAYNRLINEFNLTQEEVAKSVGKSRPSITNTLRMLNLPQKIQSALTQNRITEAHAKYLLGLDSEDKQIILFQKILHHHFSVEQTHHELKRMGGSKKARIKINYGDSAKEQALQNFFSAKTIIKRKGKGGQIIIDFYSDEELEGIINLVHKVKSS